MAIQQATTVLPNPVNRLQGRYAICLLTNTSAALLLTEWQVEVRTNFVDGTAYGDFWDVPVPIKYQWTGRARGRFSSFPSYLTAFQNTPVAGGGLQILGAVGNDILFGTFAGYVDVKGSATVADTANCVFRAPCFVEMAHFGAPEAAMVEQEVTLRGVYAPLNIR